MVRSSANQPAAKGRRKKQGVGLREIAKMASVDVSTASRALNYDPRVNAERAEQIRRLAEQMGYRPRPLRAKRAHSIGLLVCTEPDSQRLNNHMERIAWLAQRQVAERRLHLNIESIPRAAGASVPAIVQQNRVDGVLLGGHPDRQLIDEIRELGMPAVAINDSTERLGISCVRSDPEPAVRQAVLHLAARGHESFVLLATSSQYPTVHARVQSFDAALREIGITPRPEWVLHDLPGEIIGGREGIRRLRSQGTLPTAILCENDWMALGAMQELQRLGLHIPQDVSIVGHDDLWICEQLDPPLTSIHRAEEELVRRALDLLLDQITTGRHATPQEVLVQGQMTWRHSAGPAPDRLKPRKSGK